MRIVFHDGLLDHDVDLAIADLDAALEQVVETLCADDSVPDVERHPVCGWGSGFGRVGVPRM